MLGWVFFLQTKFDFLTSHFDGTFLYHLKGIVVLSLKLKRYFTCDLFSRSYGGSKIAILANLEQLMRVLEIVPNYLKEAYMP